MFIQEVMLHQFRNYSHVQQRFDQIYNLFVGDNGQGKTNFLEAIYYSYYHRSFRTVDVKNLVQDQKNCFQIKVVYTKKQIKHSLWLQVDQNRNKTCLLNGKPLSNDAHSRQWKQKSRLELILLSNNDVQLTHSAPPIGVLT